MAAFHGDHRELHVWHGDATNPTEHLAADSYVDVDTVRIEAALQLLLAARDRPSLFFRDALAHAHGVVWTLVRDLLAYRDKRTAHPPRTSAPSVDDYADAVRVTLPPGLGERVVAALRFMP